MNPISEFFKSHEIASQVVLADLVEQFNMSAYEEKEFVKLLGITDEDEISLVDSEDMYEEEVLIVKNHSGEFTFGMKLVGCPDEYTVRKLDDTTFAIMDTLNTNNFSVLMK